MRIYPIITGIILVSISIADAAGASVSARKLTVDEARVILAAAIPRSVSRSPKFSLAFWESSSKERFYFFPVPPMSKVQRVWFRETTMLMR